MSDSGCCNRILISCVIAELNGAETIASAIICRAKVHRKQNVTKMGETITGEEQSACTAAFKKHVLP